MYYETWNNAHQHVQQLRQEAHHAQQLKTIKQANITPTSVRKPVTIESATARPLNAH